jgi:signal peptidase I
MENTISEGDIILVNKLLYGTKLPMSPFEIPWVNAIYYFNSSILKKKSIVSWRYKRLKGFSSCKKNDIVVFNSPVEDKILIKRCIAVPGDTLLIDNSVVYINGNKQEYPNSIKLRFEIDSAMYSSLYEHYTETGICNCPDKNQIGKIRYWIDLDYHQLYRIIEENGSHSILRYYEHNPIMVGPTENSVLNWSLDNFGPLIIPEKGTKIKLNHENYIKYKKTLEFGEDHDITCRNDSCFIDELYQECYTFQSNYYFLMGDNRYNSMDSRYIGLVPEELLIGQTRRILVSNSNARLFWKRFFKRLR